MNNLRPVYLHSGPCSTNTNRHHQSPSGQIETVCKTRSYLSFREDYWRTGYGRRLAIGVRGGGLVVTIGSSCCDVCVDYRLQMQSVDESLKEYNR